LDAAVTDAGLTDVFALRSLLDQPHELLSVRSERAEPTGRGAVSEEDVRDRRDDVKVLRVGEDIQEDQNEGRMGPKPDLSDAGERSDRCIREERGKEASTGLHPGPGERLTTGAGGEGMDQIARCRADVLAR